MRGLKPFFNSVATNSITSHLLQMRGLKPKLGRIWCVAAPVASFTDAWIETKEIEVTLLSPLVASFTDAWIETFYSCGFQSVRNVASFTDAWIETENGYK